MLYGYAYASARACERIKAVSDVDLNIFPITDECLNYWAGVAEAPVGTWSQAAGLFRGLPVECCYFLGPLKVRRLNYHYYEVESEAKELQNNKR